jgi:Ca2+-binding RTX toxin-like protein
VHAKFVAELDSSNARFVKGLFQYAGLDVGGDITAMTPDDTLYFYGSFHSLAVFKPHMDTFIVSGFDNTFGQGVIGSEVQVIGNKAWLKDFTSPIAESDSERLIELRDDATAGETISWTKMNSPLVYSGVVDGRPRRIIGFREINAQTAGDLQQNIVAVNLTEQDGSAKVTNGVLHITGTAGGDFISIDKRAGKRIVVTGAGPTRSFSTGSLKGVQVDALGGDDLIEAYGLLTVGATINGQGGDDTIFGGQANEQIDGGSGNDYVQAGDGADALYGQRGNDTLIGGETGGDQIFGGSGSDISVKRAGSTYDSIEALNTVN